MNTTLRVDIFSDTVCPWCFLAKRRFERALAARPQLPLRLAWRPFELNPDAPPEGFARREHLLAKFGDAQRLQQMETSLVALGAAAGIDFQFERIARVPNTRRAHLLSAHAARFGLQGEVMERLMRAYFEEGIDLGDLDELVRLGVEVGLEEGAARAALLLRAGQDGIIAAERHAMVLGISGVPTFLFNGQHSLSGAQEEAVFVQILDRVAAMAAEREAAT